MQEVGKTAFELTLDAAKNRTTTQRLLDSRLALSIYEVVLALGISRTTVYALVKDGQLELRKVGRRSLITTASVESLLREGSIDG
ncbi:helix-turn-helix domain-containing protein [Sphingomonas crocodyli]|uniref:DNA-binding protein n=1 Tax=Sphingomonas crocodyli TaxID=1979270 RepID=A0A437M5S4_9SPHN|nr:helix-turn-helix domain-containing protein [Sphingomonas crocodyli]RVT92997.1 DNA-binding protein [Sphingomonas crocodyli]